jgi:hypothetical protein
METKYAHRAASSDHPGPVEPYASVGGGGVTPIPNVYTPDPVWPSDDVARQRTV